MSVKVFASSMVPRRSKAGHDRRRQLRRVGERLVCSPAVSCVRHAAHLLPHREVNLHFEPRALSSHALRARTRCRTTTAWRGSRWRTHVPRSSAQVGWPRVLRGRCGRVPSARAAWPPSREPTGRSAAGRGNRVHARAHTHMPLRRRQGQPCLRREPRQRCGPILPLKVGRTLETVGCYK